MTMSFTKPAFSAFLLLATTSSVAPINVATSKQTRKLSKKKLSKKTGGGSSNFATNIEGTYIYTNKCNYVYQSTIQCGVFSADTDLCQFVEFSLGNVTEGMGSESDALSEGAGYFTPNPTVVEGEAIDPDKTCV